jgi:AcrR family transcriptional regulator
LSGAQARIPKAERTRRQILQAAEHRFASSGFEKTRLEDVAEDIGMVGSAILYHFADKRELYRAVLDDLGEDLLSAVDESISGAGPAGERLEALVRAAVRVVASRPAFASISLREAVSDDPDFQQRTTPLLIKIIDLFEEGSRTGDVRPVGTDPYHFFSAVAGTVLFYVAALPRFAPDLPDDHLSEERIEALERDAVAITRRLLGLDEPRLVQPTPTGLDREPTENSPAHHLHKENP